jgi:UDP-3-O-[3-hydroxymyristoyl] glucosamine N-acyltransferase
MEMTLGELAQRLGAELRGDSHLLISGVAALEDATETEISFVVTPRYRGWRKEPPRALSSCRPGWKIWSVRSL